MYKLFFAALLLITVFACNKNENNTNNPPPVNDPPASLAPFLMDSSKFQFLSLVVPADTLSFWNSTTINSAEGSARLKSLTKTVYQKMKDSFDLMIFVMNNPAVPTGMPTGESVIVQNSVQGIGLSNFNNTSQYGSAGKLQHIAFLYRGAYASTTTMGPVFHEICHRWCNWIVPTNYGGHWGTTSGITGQLNSVTVPYADIELYLMGFIDASQITSTSGIAAYNSIPAASKPRVPSAANSQHHFKALFVVMSSTTLTSTEKANYNAGLSNFQSKDTTAWAYNFFRVTKGLGTLSVDNLNNCVR
jgi:trimeric autotransporter adhesin